MMKKIIIVIIITMIDHERTSRPEFKRMTNSVAFLLDFCKGKDASLHLCIFFFLLREDEKKKSCTVATKYKVICTKRNSAGSNSCDVHTEKISNMYLKKQHICFPTLLPWGLYLIVMVFKGPFYLFFKKGSMPRMKGEMKS